MDPAHAGMIPKVITFARIVQGGPRACGDDPFPPLNHVNHTGVDPAHAGMILVYLSCVTPTHSGPRACGDDPIDKKKERYLKMWTPRMRG